MLSTALEQAATRMIHDHMRPAAAAYVQGETLKGSGGDLVAACSTAGLDSSLEQEQRAKWPI
jgi:hypothetical protein